MIRLMTMNTVMLCIAACMAVSSLAGCEAENESQSAEQDIADFGMIADASLGDSGPTQDEPPAEDGGILDTGQQAPPDPDSEVAMEPDPPTNAPLDLNADCEERPVADPVASILGTLESGAEYLYAVPDDAHSLMFLFHGGGGSKEENLELRIESILIAQDALSRGYALISLDSLQHSVPGARDLKWNEREPDMNPDVANVSTLIEMFRRDENHVPEDAPIIAMGFSNGGSMASRVAQLPVVDATVIYISNAQYFNEPGARIPPTAFLPGANDPGHAVRSNTMYMEQLEDSGRTGALYINQAEPATQGIFTKIPGVDCETSKTMIRTLIASGWFDDEGNVLQDPKASTGWLQGLPEFLTSPARHTQVRDVLIELYAGHAPSAQWNDAVFEFLDQHIER